MGLYHFTDLFSMSKILGMGYLKGFDMYDMLYEYMDLEYSEVEFASFTSDRDLLDKTTDGKYESMNVMIEWKDYISDRLKEVEYNLEWFVDNVREGSYIFSNLNGLYKVLNEYVLTGKITDINKEELENEILSLSKESEWIGEDFSFDIKHIEKVYIIDRRCKNSTRYDIDQVIKLCDNKNIDLEII